MFEGGVQIVYNLHVWHGPGQMTTRRQRMKRQMNLEKTKELNFSPEPVLRSSSFPNPYLELLLGDETCGIRTLLMLGGSQLGGATIQRDYEPFLSSQSSEKANY